MSYEIESTAKFDKWYKSLKDIKTKDRLTQRISNMRFGHFGNHKRINTKLFNYAFSLVVVTVFIILFAMVKLFFYWLAVINQVKVKI